MLGGCTTNQVEASFAAWKRLGFRSLAPHAFIAAVRNWCAETCVTRAPDLRAAPRSLTPDV